MERLTEAESLRSVSWQGMRRRINKIITRRFYEAKMAMLYATFSGILLSGGLTLVLRPFSTDKPQAWSLTQQPAGLFFVVAALMITLVAWYMQSFQDYLISKTGKIQNSEEEKRQRFSSWPDRRWPGVLAFVAFVSFLAAILMLAVWYQTTGSELAVGPSADGHGAGGPEPK